MLLPDPDSPTRATTSPALTESVRPEITNLRPFCAGTETCRSSISRSGAHSGDMAVLASVCPSIFIRVPLIFIESEAFTNFHAASDDITLLPVPLRHVCLTIVKSVIARPQASMTVGFLCFQIEAMADPRHAERCKEDRQTRCDDENGHPLRIGLRVGQHQRPVGGRRLYAKAQK
ncbi:hypothetical protein D3C72_643330 [compost metagenome]